MQLITLNIWGGHVRNPLLNFIRSHHSVDIFCFQEVYHNAQKKISNDDREISLQIFSELQEILFDYQAFFRPVVNDFYGMGIFIKKKFELLGEGEVLIHENLAYTGSGPTHSRKLQWLTYRFQNQTYSVMNIHGLWNGKGKSDSPERIVQSQKIREFMDNIEAAKIVCGDFNLRPGTESIKILEKGMHNHVQLNKVNSTRTSLYPKEEKFADYILTSPEIKVNRFEVLKDEVSDHAPLLLDFL